MGEALRFFAMDADDFLDVAGNFFDVILQFIFVRMAGIGVERNDFRADVVRFAENVHGIFARDNLIAQRAFGAIADEENQIIRVAEIVFQMMPDASAFAHAGRADNDRRLLSDRSAFWIPRRRDVSEVAHAERVFVVANRVVDRRSQRFGMFFVNVRGVHAQRAVHENRDARQFAGAGEFMQHINDLLRAPDGKRGNDDFAFLLKRFADEFADQIVGVRALLMDARGVGGFDLKIIHILDGNRVAQQFIAAAPDVAAEKTAEFFAVFLHIQNHLRRTENMSGIAERDGHAGHGLKWLFVIVGDELCTHFCASRVV